MKNYVIYSNTTGEILQSGSCSDADLENQIYNEVTSSLLVCNANLHKDFINPVTLEVVAKLSNPTTVNKLAVNADSVDTIIFSNTPSNSNIFINHELFGVADGTDILVTFTTSGSYIISVEHPEYTSKEFTIDAS